MKASACSDCGCQYDLHDGTTLIDTTDVSKPRIDSVDPAGGAVAGGTPVTVTGHALDHGAALAIKFGGVAGTNVRNRTSASALVDAPAGTVKLLTQGAVTGALATGDVITGASSGHTATIVEAAPGAGWLRVSAPTGHFQAGEFVQKDVLNKVQLAATNQFNGSCDMEVSNEFGQRATGGKLVNGYAYT
jgi:hypothetical protein